MDVNITVTITKDEYVELIRKAAVHDAYARKLKADKERGGFVCEHEWALFVDDKPKVDIMDLMCEVARNIDSEPEEPDEEAMEAFFSDEEWQKIEDIAEEEKE